MTERLDVVVLGGANVDYLLQVERLPSRGETLPGGEFLESPGGKGANQAVAATRLGARVELIARLGQDARGDALLDGLRREGVGTRHVVRDAGSPSGVALILVERSGEKLIATAPGANGRLTEDDVRAARTTIATTRVLLLQLEVPLPPVALALRLARESGVTTVLDPAPAAPLDDDLLRHVDVIRPNAGEARTLTGIEVSDRATAARAARVLIERGVGAAVVQAGDEGNLLVTRRGERLFPRLDVKSVDATGAGDAFAGAMAAGLAEGRPLEECAERGNAAAAHATTQFGAQPGLPRRDELEALLNARR